MDVYVNVKPNAKLVQDFALLEPDEAFSTALFVLATAAVTANITADSICEGVRLAMRVVEGPGPGLQ